MEICFIWFYQKHSSNFYERIEKTLQYNYMYLVRDVNSPIYFHQSTNIFFNKIWGYGYFNDAVKSILMPPQVFKKVG